MAENWIRKRRKELGLTMREMAIRCAVTEANYSNWERGVAAPRVARAHELAEAFQVPLDELLRHMAEIAIAASKRGKLSAAG